MSIVGVKSLQIKNVPAQAPPLARQPQDLQGTVGRVPIGKASVIKIVNVQEVMEAMLIPLDLVTMKED